MENTGSLKSGMVTSARCLFLGLALISFFGSCKAEKTVEQKKIFPIPAVIIKPKQPVLNAEQRSELRFSPDLIAKIELAAGSEAEPFFVTVVMRSENLKGEKGFESKKLAGFSVRTRNSDEIIDSYRSTLRAQGYLIFKSLKAYGHLPDLVTIIKGNNSYDILKMQGTEAPNYHLDTKAIIAWLKARQQEGTFVVTGAGSDWLEARFIKPPRNMLAFAVKVAAFAPEVLEQGPRTSKRLAEQMKRDNGFSLVWD